MKLKQYLYEQFAITFFPIFLGLYFITSIIFLVRIASWTSVIQINFAELSLLYFYMVPSIIFYTLPITFFISMVITLSKLSTEYELIVITSFGLNPIQILKIFAPLTFFLSITLMIISLGLMPKSKLSIIEFNENKKKEANFNIKPSEFGQKFGNWLIYISSKEENKFSDVKLFKTDKGVDQFIISKDAFLDNKKGNVSFVLNEGKSFHIDNKELNQINYETMSINDSLKNNGVEKFTNAYNYWKKKFQLNEEVDKFAFSILTSIFPFISLFLVITYGYFNPRYEKNRAVMYSVLFVVIYYVFSDFLSKKILLNVLYVIPIAWVIMTYYIYAKRVKKVY